jgi:hypothetical protein
VFLLNQWPGINVFLLSIIIGSHLESTIKWDDPTSRLCRSCPFESSTRMSWIVLPLEHFKDSCEYFLEEMTTQSLLTLMCRETAGLLFHQSTSRTAAGLFSWRKACPFLAYNDVDRAFWYTETVHVVEAACRISSLQLVHMHTTCTTFFDKLCSRLITFRICVCWQRWIARNVHELFSSNSGVSHFYTACRIDELGRGFISGLTSY